MRPPPSFAKTVTRDGRRLLAVGVLPLLLGACAKTLHVVRISVTPERVSVDSVPAYIATGDSLRVVVVDHAFPNRYVAIDSAGTLVGMDRAPLFGETDLKTIAVGFPVGRALAAAPAAAQQPGAAFAARGGRVPESRAAAEIRRLRVAVDDMNDRATRITERLDSLRDRVRGDPAERARLGLLHDASWISTAQAVANDAAPGRIKALLDSLGAAGAAATIPTSRYFMARQEAVRYGRLVDALRLLMPVDQLAGVTDTSSVPGFLSNIAADVEGYERRAAERGRSLVALAAMTLSQGERQTVSAMPAALPRPPLAVLGMDLEPLLSNPGALQVRIDLVRNVVAGVNRSTSIVAGGMTLLPRWTANPDPQTVITRIYPSEHDVRVVVLRRDRFAPWTSGTGGAAETQKQAATQTTQSSTTSGTTITTVTTVTPAGSGSGGSDPKKAATPAPPAAFSTLTGPAGNDTVAVLSVPVLQRFRFHLGVGMVYSFLETTAFETRPDTVNGEPGEYVLHVGTDENRLLPMAILSYTLLPLEGRYSDRRARRYPWQNPSLQLQGGLSLQHPTEQLYAGLGGELFPGLEIGAGYHWAYVQTSNRANGTFVPFSTGPATSKEWRRGTAVSVNLDATTFVKAFGGLLGL